MSELELVRALRADVPTPTARELEAPRGRLLDAIAASSTPRRRVRRVRRVSRVRGASRLRWVPLVAALAAALVVAALHVPRAPRPTATVPAPAPHLSLAAEVLRAAARHAAAEPASRPSPEQWIYSKSVEQEPGAPVAIDENWIQFDGVKTAYWQGGRLIVHAGPASAPPRGAGTPLQEYDAHPSPMTAYDALALLPPDPVALLAAVDAEVAANPNAVAPAGGSPIAGSTRQQLEFEYLSSLVWNAAQAAPASAEASVFRAMATIPGVTAQPGATDAVGRPAIALSDGGDQQQLLFDPRTYEVTGLRTISNGHYPAPGKAGTLPAGAVVDSVSFASVALVNAAGDR